MLEYRQLWVAEHLELSSFDNGDILMLLGNTMTNSQSLLSKLLPKMQNKVALLQFHGGFLFFPSWDAKLVKKLSPWPVSALCKALCKYILYSACFFANVADFRFTSPRLLPLFPQPKSVEETEMPECCFNNWWWLPLHCHYRLKRKKFFL